MNCKEYNVLSLFDGMGCAYLAMQKAGLKIGRYYASEIDEYAIQIATKNYPDIIQLGDVKNINLNKLPKIDLLIGGSPCQDLSISKQKRQGLQGSQSILFWEYAKILKLLNPKYFLLENVYNMPEKDKQIITKELNVNSIMLNSSLLTAQNRKRLYWTNISNIYGTLKKVI